MGVAWWFGARFDLLFRDLNPSNILSALSGNSTGSQREGHSELWVQITTNTRSFTLGVLGGFMRHILSVMYICYQWTAWPFPSLRSCVCFWILSSTDVKLQLSITYLLCLCRRSAYINGKCSKLTIDFMCDLDTHVVTFERTDTCVEFIFNSSLSTMCRCHRNLVFRAGHELLQI